MEAPPVRRAPAPVEITPEPAPRAPAPARAAPAPTTRSRRGGSFARFVALVFLFLLIAAVVAAVVILSSDSTQSQDFERSCETTSMIRSTSCAT